METIYNETSLPSLRVKSIIQDKATGNTFRVLFLSSENTLSLQNGYWIQINEPKNTPKEFDVTHTQEMLAIGSMEIVADTEPVTDDTDLSIKDKEHRDRNWNLIRHIVAKEPDIYIPGQRMELLQSVETSSGVKVQNLYKHLGKYWRSGFQINALAPNYKNCGGARKATSLEKQVGRRKREGENGKILDETDYIHFQHAISTFYQGLGMTLHQTYNAMLSRDYVRPRYNGDLSPVTMAADEKPSFGQFYYWHRHHKDVVEDTKKREGERNFDLKYRAITGTTDMELIGPGDSYQIDATIGDFYLVMKSDRARVVGRPIVVFIKDAWSRMVTGMHVTLENSSCQVWKDTLLNAVTDKVDYCKTYGISITKEEWPCDILPVSITTDNGEFAVHEIDDIVRSLGITVENCPPYRGDLKGIIERTFKTFQLTLKPYIPGYVEKDAGQRGAKDYRKDACLDLDTFTMILVRIVLYYNNYHYLDNYPRTDGMRKENVPSIPLHLWNYGIAHKTGALKKLPTQNYMDALMRKGEATVTGKGIHFRELYYTCEIAVRDKWFEKARIEGNYTIPVRYNSSSVKSIYVKGSDGEYHVCSLTESNARYESYTEEELKAAHEEDLNIKASCTQKENQAYSDMVHIIDASVKRCMNEKNNAKTVGEVLTRNSIPENREEEKANLSGENEARKNQEGMDTENSFGEKTHSAEEKPKSFEAVSDEIDRILADLGLGVNQTERKKDVQ